MTREEAQSLAEDLVRDAARGGRWLEFQEAGDTFCQGVKAFVRSVMANEEIHTGAIVSLAGCALELLRESFLQSGGSVGDIRADHEAYLHRGRPSN